MAVSRPPFVPERSMKTLSTLALLALVHGQALAAPAPAPSAPPPAPAPAAAPAPAPAPPGVAAKPTMIEILRSRAAGSPVFIFASDAGLSARSADGKLDEPLAPGPATEVRFDPALDLVWYRSGAELRMLDLRARVAEPIVVVRGVPADVEYRIAQPGDARPDDLSSHVELVLTLGKKAKLSSGIVQGMDWDWWYGPEQQKPMKARVKQAKKAKLLAGKQLAALVGRAPRAKLIMASHAAPSVPVPAAMNAGCEEDPDMCGLQAGYGKWQLVYSSHSCGDFCYQSCLLHDPATRRWSQPPSGEKWLDAAKVPADGSGSCGDYLLDREQQWVLTEDAVCKLGKPCTTLTGRPVGWLDPGPAFVLPVVKGPPN